ncbi:MAG: RloB family protein [Candidatus Cloacimonas sp.]
MSRTKRPHNIRKPAPDLIVIVTEGEKTEPNYFKKFPVYSIEFSVIGTGMNTISLIKEAEIQVEKQIDKFKEKYGEEPKETIVWCVFDKDSFSDEDFGNAINKAKAKGYKVAYSNEAFELWYLLHFHYYDMALGRNDYIVKLTEHLKRKYRKNDLFMYETLLSKQEEAINNAKNLLSKYITVNPSNNNPSTTVFELVEYLNQFIHY